MRRGGGGAPGPAALGIFARLLGGSRFRREPEDPVMALGDRREVLTHAGGRLRGAKHEIAVGGKPLGNARKHGTFGSVVEIDQHIPAKDHVERAERLTIVEEILVAKFDLASDLGAEFPTAPDFIEIFHEERHWQAPLDLELAVKPFARFGKRFVDKVGGEDLNRPAGKLAVPLG
jgi:hypothetical protein